MDGENLSLFGEASTPPREEKRPRPYQLEALAAVRDKLAVHRSTAVILMTGGGKTFIAAHAAKQAGGRVLFLAHLDTLVQQSRRELQAITGQPWDLEQGENRAIRNSNDHVVASVQTLMRGPRLATWPADAFGLIIVDEAHHYVASSFKKPLDHFKSAKILALTATPDRADRKALKRYVESVAFKMDLVDGINQGWSVPIICRPPVACDVDLGKVAVSKVTGDFDPGALDDAMVECIAPIVKAALEHCGDAPTVIFTPGVKTAHAVSLALNRHRIGLARAVDGAMNRDQQRANIAAWKRGDCQFMANCRVLTEGFDFPALAYMIDAAPTKSRALKAQKVGRVLRPLANVDACASAEERKAAIAASPKPSAVWIDLAFNGTSSALITPTDVLGGTFTDKEKAAAKKKLSKGGGDPLEALQEARRQLAAKAAKAKVRLELGSFDPTASGRPARKKAAPKVDAATVPPSPGQLRELARRSIPGSACATKADALSLIRYEFLADKNRWCNYHQRVFLQEWVGISGRGMKQSDAARVVAHWRALGKPHKLTAEQLASVPSRDVGAEG